MIFSGQKSACDVLIRRGGQISSTNFDSQKEEPFNKKQELVKTGSKNVKGYRGKNKSKIRHVLNTCALNPIKRVSMNSALSTVANLAG